MTENTELDTRSEYIAGLRAMANLLETNPHLCLPHPGNVGSFLVIPQGDQKQALADWIRALPGMVTKSPRDNYFDVLAKLRGLSICVIAEREQVCRRVVTGQREVTKEVPTATTTLTVTEDVVEWQCESLLAEATA